MVKSARSARDRPAYAISSVDHALRLAAVLQLEGSITVTAAAQRLGVAPSTAHRLLSMLVYRDFAVKDGSTYRVGPVLKLGAADLVDVADGLRDAALPHLRVLSTQFDETSNVAIRTGLVVRFIASVEGTRVLRVGSRSGMAFPAHRTTPGLILLAALEDAEITELYTAEPWDFSEPKPELPALLALVETVRDQGFAVNNGLSEKGVFALGYPLRGPDRTPVAAISLSIPSARFEPSLLRPMLHALKRTARAIESSWSNPGEGEPQPQGVPKVGA